GPRRDDRIVVIANVGVKWIDLQCAPALAVGVAQPARRVVKHGQIVVGLGAVRAGRRDPLQVAERVGEAAGVEETLNRQEALLVGTGALFGCDRDGHAAIESKQSATAATVVDRTDPRLPARQNPGSAIFLARGGPNLG